jgi:hypothetical protein
MGYYEPHFVEDVHHHSDHRIYARPVEIPGLSSAVSDVLDDWGYRLAVPTTEIAPLKKIT